MSRLADLILHLHGWVALLVIFAVPALESSAFLGFLFPGEIAVLLGGVLAFQHRVSLAAALAAGIAGAVIGDSVGFEVGKRWGRTLLHGTVGRVVKKDHLDRAERYLAERGGKAVFFGRFTAALRVLIPGMAGMAGMPYRTFAAFNIAGGVLWAGGFVILGYVAGNGYKRFEKVAKQASLLLLLGAVAVVAVVVAVRWAIRHRAPLEEFGRRQIGRPRVAATRRRYRTQLDFLGRRMRPGGAQGLALTMALVALLLAGWAFGVVVSSVLRSGGLVGTDQPVLDFFVRHRTGWLTAAMKVLSTLGATWLIVGVAATVGVWLRVRCATWRPALLLGTAVAGGWVLSRAVGALVGRRGPPTSLAAAGYGRNTFPSMHVTLATVLFGALALVASAWISSWPLRVTVWATAIVAAATVGATRSYLGAEWGSDVVGGWAAGALWLFVVAVVVQVARAPVDSASRDLDPSGFPGAAPSL